MPDYSRPVKVFDFFCGCGGTSAGMQAAGMEIVFGLDNDYDAGQTFQANFPKATFESKSIQDFGVEALHQHIELYTDAPLLFSACAPCQPFSLQRRGTLPKNDDRFGLLGNFLPFVERYQPDLLFIENVPGLRSRNLGRSQFEHFTKILKDDLKYHTQCDVVYAWDYGVPQRRARLILLASRIGPIGFPAKTHGPETAHPQYSTVADWIGDAERFPPIAAGETCQDVQKHRAAGLSPLNLQRIQATSAGGDWRDWPAELVPECHEKFSGYPDVYGRLEWDKLAPTLTTRCISYSNGRFGHPEQDRAISVREAACLQTFSDEFIAQLQGGLTSQARQVGNAVPMLLAQRFGEYLIHHVKQLTEVPVPEPPHSD